MASATDVQKAERNSGCFNMSSAMLRATVIERTGFIDWNATGRQCWQCRDDRSAGKFNGNDSCCWNPIRLNRIFRIGGHYEAHRSILDTRAPTYNPGEIAWWKTRAKWTGPVPPTLEITLRRTEERGELYDSISQLRPTYSSCRGTGYRRLIPLNLHFYSR